MSHTRSSKSDSETNLNSNSEIPSSSGSTSNSPFWQRSLTKNVITHWYAKEEKGKKRWEEKANKLIDHTKKATGVALFPVSLFAVMVLCGEPNSEPARMMDGILKPLAIPGVILGPPIDIVKLPLGLSVAGIEALGAGFCRVFSLMFDNPTKEMQKALYASFMLRLSSVIQLLIKLKLETVEEINKKLESGNFTDLVGLTLLDTVYCSRNIGNKLILENGHLLAREHCPPNGLPLFSIMMALKDFINAGLDSANPERNQIEDDQKREQSDAKTVFKWIKVIKEAKNISHESIPDATTKQITHINNIIDKYNAMKDEGMKLLMTLKKPLNEIMAEVKVELNDNIAKIQAEKEKEKEVNNGPTFARR